MRKNKVYCLHGFLGLPSDWDFLVDPENVELEKVDVFKVLSPTPNSSQSNSMIDWAQAFNETVSRDNAQSRILLGYSMGGRLALHSLVRNPSLWDGAVIVSANPAPLPEERAPRQVADETWARRFETEPWENLVSAWEGHSVFGGKQIPFKRRESDFRRTDLTGAFRAWSLSRQEKWTRLPGHITLPGVWITGEQDSRYREIAQRVCAQTSDAPIDFVSIADGSHRVPWEQTETFQTHFRGFLQRIFC